MEVKLLMGKHHLEMMEYNAAYAMLTCHANTDKLKDEPPSEFLKRAMKVHHDTVLEHIYLTYEVNNLSRACLQELARHRHISLSVESTRHTLKKKFEQKDFSVPEHIPVVSCGDISHLLKDKTQNDVTLDEVLIGFIYTAYIQNPDVPADSICPFGLSAEEERQGRSGVVHFRDRDRYRPQYRQIAVVDRHVHCRSRPALLRCEVLRRRSDRISEDLRHF